jgi:hypothetical protein
MAELVELGTESYKVINVLIFLQRFDNQAKRKEMHTNNMPHYSCRFSITITFNIILSNPNWRLMLAH